MAPTTGSEQILVNLGDEELEHDLGSLLYDVARSVQGGPRTIVVDVARLTTLTRRVVGLLLRLDATARSRRRRAVLRHPSTAVERALIASRLDRMLWVETAG